MQINLSKSQTEHMAIGDSEDEDEPEAGAVGAPADALPTEARPRLRLGHELISRTNKYHCGLCSSGVQTSKWLPSRCLMMLPRIPRAPMRRQSLATASLTVLMNALCRSLTSK